jgi:hypothetical protein
MAAPVRAGSFPDLIYYRYFTGSSRFMPGLLAHHDQPRATRPARIA